MSIYNIKQKYVSTSGEVKIYEYKRQYDHKIKKFDNIKDKYKDVFTDDKLNRLEKINKIYELEKDNYTLKQIQNLIYRNIKQESNDIKPHKTYKDVFTKYKDIINDNNLRKIDKVNKIYELEKNNYTHDQIKNFIYKHL